MRSHALIGVAATLLLSSYCDTTWAQSDSTGPFSLSYASLARWSEPTTQPSAEDDEHTATSTSDASSTGDLAMKLQNPVADLISVPLQSNFDFGGGISLPTHGRSGFLQRVLPRGPARFAVRAANFVFRDEPDRDQAFKYLLNIQPVVPITLNDEWNVISRTILPIVYQDDVLGASSQGGMGDVLQSFFLSPRSTEPFIWGAGPVFLFPTATDDSLGSERWAMGPTGVLLKQDGPWTYGILANHLWSFARDDNRKEINATYLQPFLSYTTKSHTTFVVNTESTYDWIDNQWTVPLIGGVSQLVKIGKLPVSLGVNGKYYVEGPESAPDWGVRFTITFLFPK